MSQDPFAYTWWLAGRTFGIVGLVAMSAAVATGLFMATRGEPRRPGAAKVANGLHQHLAIVGLVATLLHVGALLLDPWLEPGLTGVLLPGAIDYRPLWVAAGIVGFYVALLLGASHAIRRRIGVGRWKAVHRLETAAYGMVVLHVLGAGTDAGTLWLRVLLLATFAPALFNLVLRLTNPERRRPVLTER